MNMHLPLSLHEHEGEKNTHKQLSKMIDGKIFKHLYQMLMTLDKSSDWMTLREDSFFYLTA